MSEEDEKGLEADVLAATLAGGLQESQDLLEYLARKFEGPLSQLISVRRRGGLLAKNRTIEEITLRFDDRRFQITRDARGFMDAKILKEVRGVVLKTNHVEIDEWLRELSVELARQAERSDSVRSALSRFIIG
jgi:hypothetical protein